MVEQAEGNLFAGSQRNELAFVVLHDEAYAHRQVTDTLALSAFAVNLHITAVAAAHIEGNDTRQRLAQSRLAGAARTCQHSEAAFFYSKADVAQHQVRLFISKIKIFYINNVFHYFSSS